MSNPAAALRGLIVGPLIVLWTGFLSAVAVAGSKVARGPRFGTFLLRFWSRTTCAMAGIRVVVDGSENLPRGGAVFVFNHSSHFDIPVIHTAIPNHLRFGAKIELFKIPFFGQAMRDFGVLPIVRSNRADVLQIYRESIARVQAGMSFILAPEGTRQDGDTLGPFKSGPFIFAVEGELSIIPVVLVGVNRVLPKHGLWVNPRRWIQTVRVRILPAVSARGYTAETRPELQRKVREMMVAAHTEGLAQLPPP